MLFASKCHFQTCSCACKISTAWQRNFIRTRQNFNRIFSAFTLSRSRIAWSWIRWASLFVGMTVQTLTCITNFKRNRIPTVVSKNTSRQNTAVHTHETYAKNFSSSMRNLIHVTDDLITWRLSCIAGIHGICVDIQNLRLHRINPATPKTHLICRVNLNRFFISF